MNISGDRPRRIAVSLVLFLLVSLVALAQDAPVTQPAGGVSNQNQSTSSSDANSHPQQSTALPDSPGSVRSQTPTATTPQSSGPQTSPQTQQNGTQTPVGTAAAESIPTTGVAASNPAGAAIAPARQRRTRSILIKVGAIVGAGVAVGTVAALSSSSPSRPPASR